MSDMIGQLEQRVSQAVRRLSQLSAEKQQLEAELLMLQQRIDGSGDTERYVNEGGEIHDDWQATRHELLQLIRETLEESREPNQGIEGNT